MKFNESQASLDSSFIVSPPDDEKSSFASPRLRQKAVRIRPQITALNSVTDSLDLDNEESIEQKYLKKRIEERPKHNPHLPKDVQVKSIMLKSQQPYEVLYDKKDRIRHLEAEEERVQRLKKMNENEPGNTVVLERGVPQMTSPQLVPLNKDNLQKSSRRSNSADSDHSEVRRKLDSQESNRSDTLYGMKGKAESKAMKKIEWLENYVDIRNKQNIPLNTADLERCRQVLSKLSGVDFPSGVNENVNGSATVGSDSAIPVVVQQTNTVPMLQPEPPSQLNPSPQSKPESTSDEVMKVVEELESENEVDDVVSLKKQLTEAKREIEKLRLERALLHAKSEIKKLKTEITYGRENENEEVNIDKIAGIEKKKDNSGLTTSSIAVPSSSSRVSSPASGVTNSSTRESSPGPKPDLPAKAMRNTLLKMKSVEENPQRTAGPRRSTGRGTKMGLKGIGGGASGQRYGSSRWSTISGRIISQGSESLMEEDELEEYREEKRKRKQKKKFLQDIEDTMISRDAGKTKANPKILKQMQSFDFLNFLDSLDGLNGNTLKNKSEQTDVAKVE